jgi:arabinose-5-phosphate isomerase
MINRVKDIAKKTIDNEANALMGLLHYIDDSFEKAVYHIHHSKGRVVVAGIGKSAIIAQKIVATLNSTGTAAIFMHAADAIHGDLGMIQPADTVILISKSGESPEIKVLIPLIRNFGNFLIGIGGDINSALALECDLFLNTTVSQEACPNNLAPTSSATAQMVMGDALAVCLMNLKGFTGNDFAKFHPGGNLGKRLYLRVENICKNNQKPCVSETDGIRKIIVEITKGRLGATAVLKEEELIGIITDGDIRRLLESQDQLGDITAGNICTKTPKVISIDALAVEALNSMKMADISQLLVIDSTGGYAGIIHLHDLVKEGII